MKKDNIFVEIFIDFIYALMHFFKENLTIFANILSIILPYIMLYVGQTAALERKEFAIGGEIFIPLIFAAIIYILRTAANKLGKGITVPIPAKRFTKVDDDGEVTIENRRIQELILYLADLEDWLERKGLL